MDTASAARALDRGAPIVDARGARAARPYVRGARLIEWTEMRDGFGRTGRLDDDLDAVARHLEAAGVRWDRAVYVIGAAREGWGEEGRIWWTLRYLGHDRVFIIDGGVRAWIDARLPTADAPLEGTRGPPGSSRPARLNLSLRVSAEEISRATKSGSASLLDARTREEYEGATPYLEARAGHIQGALSLPWVDLLRPDGKLRSTTQLEAIFEQHGVTAGQPGASGGSGRSIAYCTGGVRSAFVVAVLRHLGRDAANYDGSFWEWARRPELPITNSP